jgi:outer membrane protein
MDRSRLGSRSLGVKSLRFVLPALAAALSAVAQTNGKVAVINIQSAIVSTKDGQKAAGEIETRFNPKKAEFERRQAEISKLQDDLNRGRNALSPEAQQNLARDIDQKTKALNRDTEDAQADLQQEDQRLMGELYSRMRVVVEKYAKDNGFVLVLNVGPEQGTVMYASSAIDITRDIIELYDKNSPGAPTSSGAARPSASVAPASSAPKPVAPAK